jgi:ATPase subunit of ABC transporter with duplicated ATPase domains
MHRLASGRIGGWPANLSCFLVEQEVAGSAKSALVTVMDSDHTRTALLKREQELLQQIADKGGEAPSKAGSVASASSSSSSSKAASSSAPKAKAASTKTKAKAAAASSAEEELVDLYEKLSLIDADSAEARAAEILDELGFSVEMQAAPTSTLSGGWRMRCSLACALFMQPDVLLLDEPTNHLDLHGVLWLTDYIQGLSQTCVIVSHDARFLSDVTTDIIHFKDCQLSYYSGNFDTFLNSRSEQLKHTARQQEALDAKRAHIRASIDKVKQQAAKHGHSEQKLGMVASRQKKLGRMGFEKTADGKKFNTQLHGRREGCENNSGMLTSGSANRRVAMSMIEPPEPGFRFAFPQPDMDKIAEGDALLTLKDVSFGYGNGSAGRRGRSRKSSGSASAAAATAEDEFDMESLRSSSRAFAAECHRCLLEAEVPPVPDHANSPLLFGNLDLTIRAGNKVGIVGPNGAGKSTLLGLLTGLLTPSSGEALRHPECRVAYFAQHLVEALDVRLSPVQHLLNLDEPLAREMKTGPNAEQNARQVLGRFGLAGSLALAPIGTLSGGQKARLVFASITLSRPHLLVLDEPTNHLDLVTSGALLDALRDFPGASICVSHDQTIMDSCGELLLVEKRVEKKAKLNPNQLTAAATKAKKEQAAAAQAAAKKARSSASAAAASSSSAAGASEKLNFPSRCAVRKLAVSFEEYRESVLESL